MRKKGSQIELKKLFDKKPKVLERDKTKNMSRGCRQGQETENQQIGE